MRRYWATSIHRIALLACYGLGACSSNSGAPVADASVGSPSGIVVLNSNDFDTSSVSFLDRAGNLVIDGCFSTPKLSSDVVLPTQVTPGGPVVLIDRGMGYNALTWLDPMTCTIG